MSNPFVSNSRPRRLRLRPLLGGLLVPVLLVACSGDDHSVLDASAVDDDSALEPPAAEFTPAELEDLVNTAFYLEMRDGVRIAVDLWLPRAASAERPLATIVRATPYWRDTQVLDRTQEPETENEAMAKSFARAGYAALSIDARGTGASFGTRAQPWSPAEVADYGEIVDWVVRQPWSNGRIGAFGISYDSNAAEMIATLGNPAVKAVIPRFGYPNVYTDVMFPGGIFNQGFVNNWFERGKLMDANDLCSLADIPSDACPTVQASGAGVKRVDADSDFALRNAASEEHATGPDQFALVSTLQYVDDRWDGFDFGKLSPGLRGAQAVTRHVPYMAWASWLDLGTAQGALNRWATTQVPMTVYIGPWNHDASTDSNPFRPKDAPLEMSGVEQRQLELQFFDRHLKGNTSADSERKIVYYTLGADRWQETREWPPPGTRVESLYLRNGNALSAEPPATPEAVDRYPVDFTASTGPENGWWTKFTGADVYQADRRDEDRKLLTYTTAPLTADTEITGHPSVTLHLSSTEPDGAVFVYLEDLAPDGRVTYITEGELRLSLRKPCDEPAAFDVYGPCHTYRASDAEPMPIGVLQEVRVGLHPTSVLLRAGHAVRIAVAGHDASTFTRIPASGAPSLSVAHGPEYPSRLELPIQRPTSN